MCRFLSSSRLKRSFEFDTVFRTGRPLNGALVRLFYVSNKDEPTRVGVAVGRKIANSVARSRGKRILREALRRLLPHIKPGYWIVASLRAVGLSSSAVAIHEDIAAVLQAKGIIGGEYSKWQ